MASLGGYDKGDLICHSSTFRICIWAAQDGSIRGQLEISARRVDYIITKRNPNEPPAQQDEEQIPF